MTEQGVAGDRYSDKGDITLIEAEALDGLREDTGIELSHEGPAGRCSPAASA